MSRPIPRPRLAGLALFAGLVVCAAACADDGSEVATDGDTGAATIVESDGQTQSGSSQGADRSGADESDGDESDAGRSGSDDTAADTEQPIGDRLDISSIACGSVPAEQNDGLTVQVLLANETVERGGQTQARVMIANPGSQPKLVGSGSPLETVLTRTGTSDVVGRQRIEVNAADAGAPGLSLGPGESLALPVLVGTESCADDGQISPGTYDLVVLVSRQGGSPVRSDVVTLVVS